MVGDDCLNPPQLRIRDDDFLWLVHIIPASGDVKYGVLRLELLRIHRLKEVLISLGFFEFAKQEFHGFYSAHRVQDAA